ncbi:MAG: porphobilinogen synthase [Planctomycetota bacterium]|nr:porphobilinogen synthase [Planctomycetota bacterium]
MNAEPSFPTLRMRRLRYNAGVRSLTRHTRLHPGSLILPLFVRVGENIRQEIGSMPGQYQLSIDQLIEEAKEARDLGLGGVILFGIPDEKDHQGSDALHAGGIVQQAVAAVKNAVPNLLVLTDLCMCEYTDHGHCGILHDQAGITDVSNDPTLEYLGKQAVTHAEQGADVIAPSGMMDGMVQAIRSALDGAGFTHIPIMSYSAKYASSYYGPFRDAAESAPSFGDRRTYQMDPTAQAEQALREVELDVQEGADMLMVKPALAYLDIITRVAQTYPGIPLAAYNVSGEYSMVKAAAAQGWIDEARVVDETMTAIHRAGAGIILTYWAKDVARRVCS